jgi:N-acetylmuramic acid 6-phosphate etherase
MDKTTEKSSDYRFLEEMSTANLLLNINKEDEKVPAAIKTALPQIEKVAEVYTAKLKEGGRVFYIGSGTSGRLAIVDASELPPTYGLEFDKVVGIIAGGDTAIRKAVEFAEDDTEQGWQDLQKLNISSSDFVIGISASGATPYVVGALDACKKNGIATACITCNMQTALASVSDYPIEVIVGPEFVTGSTRMKAGTAQKLVLNMLSTTAMIKSGRVMDNKMIDMQLTNNKLIDRGIRIIAQSLALSYDRAKHLLEEYGSVRKVIERKGKK